MKHEKGHHTHSLHGADGRALLAACGAQPAEPDLDELAFQLRDSAGFGEEMYLLDEGIARELYGLGTDASCVAWSGAGGHRGGAGGI